MEHSALVWIQIPSKKLDRAVKFYKNVFDASFILEKLNNIPHAIFKEGKGNNKLINGALIEVSEQKYSALGPVLYFNATGNFENILELIEENKGEIITKKTLITSQQENNTFIIPNTYIDEKPGYYAHFIDSEGNKMGLYGTN
jgi:predicted enzyme related to lactoylglutathione lyase